METESNANNPSRTKNQLSGEKPPSKDGKRKATPQKSGVSDKSQDSVVKKLNDNKIFDSDEEKDSAQKKPRRLKKLQESSKQEDDEDNMPA